MIRQQQSHNSDHWLRIISSWTQVYDLWSFLNVLWSSWRSCIEWM